MTERTGRGSEVRKEGMTIRGVGENEWVTKGVEGKNKGDDGVKDRWKRNI